MYKNQKISLILPAYNEEESVASVINKFLKLKVIDEILVVDNNSKDNTAKIAKQIKKVNVLREKKQGYGYALRKGLKKATGDLLVLCDVDNTYEARDLFKLLSKSSKYDFVFATRTKRSFNLKGSNMDFLRRIANISVAKLIQVLFRGPNLTDPGATFRLLKKSAYKSIEPYLKVGGGHFQPELTIHALLKGYSIIEVPVYYRGRTGQSKISGSIIGGLRTAKAMVAIIIYYWYKYKL